MNRRDFIKRSAIVSAYITFPISTQLLANQTSRKGHSDLLESNINDEFIGKTFFIDRPIILSQKNYLDFKGCTFVFHDDLYLCDKNIITITPECENKHFNYCVFKSFSSYVGRKNSQYKDRGLTIYIEPRDNFNIL